MAILGEIISYFWLWTLELRHGPEDTDKNNTDESTFTNELQTSKHKYLHAILPFVSQGWFTEEHRRKQVRFDGNLIDEMFYEFKNLCMYFSKIYFQEQQKVSSKVVFGSNLNLWLES